MVPEVLITCMLFGDIPNSTEQVKHNPPHEICRAKYESIKKCGNPTNCYQGFKWTISDKICAREIYLPCTTQGATGSLGKLSRTITQQSFVNVATPLLQRASLNLRGRTLEFTGAILADVVD